MLFDFGVVPDIEDESGEPFGSPLSYPPGTFTPPSSIAGLRGRLAVVSGVWEHGMRNGELCARAFR